jgi:uncharacterized membrane protein (DUF441 family)
MHARLTLLRVRAEELAAASLLSTFYLALIYLLSFGVRMIAAGLIHPIAPGRWLLRYLIAVASLEALAAAIASLAVAHAARSFVDRPGRVLLLCGLISGSVILALPQDLTAAATPLTIVWASVVHAASPAAAHALWRSNR